jgi:hypothetical protein
MSSPASHPAEADFMGSLIATLFCTEVHLGQSNSRCSNPTGPGLTPVSVIRDAHCGQRGRSIGVSRDLGGNSDFDITLPCKGGSVTELSVTDGCRWRGGDRVSMAQCKSCLLVNIAHSPKFSNGSGSVSGRSFVRRGALISQKALVETTVHQGTAFLAGYVIRGRFGHSDVVFCSANACMRSG